ncbi:hypothetical protein CP1MG86_MNBNLCLN_02617 [Companilactobacillus paralimentarius]
MSEDKLSLLRSWRRNPVDPDKVYNIQIPDISDDRNEKKKTVTFMHRTVNVERQHNQIWSNRDHTQLLPRESFVLIDFTDVLFINMDDAVYVAIFTSDKTRVDQILQLICKI